MLRMKAWTIPGLWAVLVVGMLFLPVMAGASPQASAPQVSGQVREIKIDQCDQRGMCAGSIVLAQPQGEEFTVPIAPNTPIQRGNEHVHLAELGVGNYVTVQASPVASNLPGRGRTWTWEQYDAWERSPINSGSQGGGD